MAKTPNIKTILKAALDVASVWKTIPDFKMGGVSVTDFTSAINAADTLTKQHANNAVERAGLKANRDDKAKELADLVSRFRSGVRAAYGSDSPLYEQAGGTRKSARKPPKRKAKAPTAKAKPAKTPEASTAETVHAGNVPMPAAAVPAPNGAAASHT